MTEKEWRACTDPGPMLVFMQKNSGNRRQSSFSDRKERLFACGCCRRIWHRLVDERSRKAVEVAERCADGNVNQAEMAVAARDAYIAATDDQAYDNDVVAAPEYAAVFTIGVYDATLGDMTATPSFSSLNAAENAAVAIANRKNLKSPDDSIRESVLATETLAQAELFRCIFGNPFRPVSIDQALLTWRDATIPKLAQAAYGERELPSGHLDVDRLRVLADALEEAGCTNEDILAHLRGPGPHVRGCWVVDLLLGKR